MPENKDIEEIKQTLLDLLHRQDEVEDRLSDIGRENGRHKVILAKEFYQSDAKGILEVTRISKLASGPLSLALATSDYLSKEIQSGKVSLPRKRLDYFFRLQLSGGGWNRAMSIPVLQEQVGSEAGEEEGFSKELEAGGQ